MILRSLSFDSQRSSQSGRQDPFKPSTKNSPKRGFLVKISLRNNSITVTGVIEFDSKPPGVPNFIAANFRVFCCISSLLIRATGQNVGDVLTIACEFVARVFVRLKTEITLVKRTPNTAKTELIRGFQSILPVESVW